MDPDKLERLRKNHKILKSDLDTSVICDHLLEEGVFTFEDSDAVRGKNTPSDQNEELLSRVRRRGNGGYDKLMQVLKKTQPHLQEKVENTPLDQEVTGEDLTENIFYNPSEDFELKRLIDQLTKDGHITQDLLERMKFYAIGEAGCSASVITTKDNPLAFFRHLMDVLLITRYNLSFLQSLLWTVDLKDKCEYVAAFARTSDKEPVYFFTQDKTENGFVPCDIHVAGNVSNFTGFNVEEICYRISRYLGLPRARVRPIGIKPSNSIVITVLIPETSSGVFMKLGDYWWLAELGVDLITVKDETVGIGAPKSESNGETSLLERELLKKLESEKLLKKCLYNEQVANEELRSLNDKQKEDCRGAIEDLAKQSKMNSGLFCALMTSLFLVTELLRRNLSSSARAPTSEKERSARLHLKNTVKRAREGYNTDLLQEVIDAHAVVKDIAYSFELTWLVQGFRAAFERFQALCVDALANVEMGRMVGAFRTQMPPQLKAELQLEIRQAVAVSLNPELHKILDDLGGKLNTKQAEKLVESYKLPQELKQLQHRHQIFHHIMLTEINSKQGLAEVRIEELMEEATCKVCGRRELWEEFKAMNKRRLKARERTQTDVPHRLDNIEQLLQKLVAQNNANPFPQGYPFFGQEQFMKYPYFGKTEPTVS